MIILIVLAQFLHSKIEDGKLKADEHLQSGLQKTFGQL